MHALFGAKGHKKTDMSFHIGFFMLDLLLSRISKLLFVHLSHLLFHHFYLIC